jgi:integral membrane sensor domain MASE1
MPGWHRVAGRLAVACGLAAGLSGLWMTRFYPRVEGDSALLDAFRYLSGSAMIGCLVLGVVAVRRRDMQGHAAWMTRGYAIGMGAGTQFLVHVPWLIVFGKPGVLARALLMGAGWAINVVVAEAIVRRRRGSVTRPTAASRTRAETLLQTYSGSHSRPAEPLP